MPSSGIYKEVESWVIQFKFKKDTKFGCFFHLFSEKINK